MKRLHVLLGMFAATVGFALWVEHRRAEALREPSRGVRGRVVDVYGEPVHGCAVTVEERDKRAAAMATTSGRDGTFEFEFQPGSLRWRHEVVARAEGCAPATAPVPSPRREFVSIPDLVLVPGTPLRGRLLDGDGRPRGGVELGVISASIVTMSLSAWASSRTATTDSDGGFRFPDPIEAGWWFVRSEGATIRPACVLVAPGRDHAFDFELDDRVDTDIRGRIVDDLGAPLPEATGTAVSMGTPGADLAVDAEGRFVVGHLAQSMRTPMTLRADCEGHFPAQLGGVAWGARDVELVLRRKARIRVAVVDGEGAPVPGVPVRIGEDFTAEHDSLPDTDAAGIVELPCARYGQQVVHVDADPSWREAALVEVDTAAGAPREAVLTVGTAAKRTLRVQQGAAAPVVGARVEVRLVPCAGEDEPVRDASIWFERGWDIESGETDAHGVVAMRLHPQARYVVQVEARGRNPTFREWPSDARDVPFVVDLGQAAHLRGTLRPADVVRQLRASAPEPSLSVEAWRTEAKGGDARRATAEVAADGSFAIPGLESGDWMLRLCYAVGGRWRATEPLVVLASLRDGETREVTLDVATLALTPRTGSVTVNGSPHVGAFTIQVERRGADGELHQVDVPSYADVDGRFRCLLPPGRCRALVVVGDEAGCVSAVPSPFVAAADGEAATTAFHVDAVLVDVVTRRADGEPVDAPWELAEAGTFVHPTRVAPGSWRALLPPGHHQIIVRRAALLDQLALARWIGDRLDRGESELDLDLPAGEIVVPAGQARAQVEIVLPEAAGY